MFPKSVYFELCQVPLKSFVKMQVVYARTSFPPSVEKMLFLAGPTPRDPSVVSWRVSALQILEELKYDGVVFVPEDAGGGMSGSYEDQVQWESDALNRSDCILFWVPREMETMPGLTTNDEFGTFKGRARVVFGAPPEAVKVRYQRSYCDALGIASSFTLRDTLVLALSVIGSGAKRTGSNVLIPANVFVTPVFQQWKKANGDNEVLDAKVRDLVTVAGRTFLFVLWVKIRIVSENRIKDNELVVGRAPVSCVAVYCAAKEPMDMKVVLVREFRSAGGFVTELPGGSVLDDGERDAADVAIEEIQEEIGFAASKKDLIRLGARTSAPTLLPHLASAFAIRVSDEQMREFERMERENVSFGKAEDTEKTFVLVRSLRQCFEGSECCWTTLGILGALMKETL